MQKKCTSKTELRKKYPIAYKYAKKNNWILEYTWFLTHKNVLSSINDSQKQSGFNTDANTELPIRVYWTFDRCHKEAQKYTLKSEFREKSSNTYQAARKNGWLKDYGWPMGGTEIPFSSVFINVSLDIQA